MGLLPFPTPVSGQPHTGAAHWGTRSCVAFGSRSTESQREGHPPSVDRNPDVQEPHMCGCHPPAWAGQWIMRPDRGGLFGLPSEPSADSGLGSPSWCGFGAGGAAPKEGSSGPARSGSISPAGPTAAPDAVTQDLFVSLQEDVQGPHANLRDLLGFRFLTNTCDYSYRVYEGFSCDRTCAHDVYSRCRIVFTM